MKSLQNCLERFDENVNRASYNKWYIAKGGYDRWWSLTYDGSEIAYCVDGDIEVLSVFDLYSEKKKKDIIETLMNWDKQLHLSTETKDVICKKRTFNCSQGYGKCSEDCEYGAWNNGTCGAECLACGGNLFLSHNDRVLCDECGFEDEREEDEEVKENDNEKDGIDTLTAADFNVDEASFEWIMFYLEDKGITTKEAALDYHVEPSEEAMFNWIHDGDETPWKIRSAELPSESEQCAEINGYWYFWYDGHPQKASNDKTEIKIVNIKWDTDGDTDALAMLPKEISIPNENFEKWTGKKFSFDNYEDEEDFLTDIEDYLTDEYEYCHDGFEVEGELFPE